MSTLRTWSVALSLVFLAVFGYSVTSVVTYRLHEAMYPGEICTPHEEHEHCRGDSSVVIGMFWPLGLPITLAMYASRALPAPQVPEDGQEASG